MIFHSLGGVVSNLRSTRAHYQRSKFGDFEDVAREVASLMLAAIGDDAMALNSAIANDSDRARPKLPEGYWIEMEMAGKLMRGWFETVPFKDGDKVAVVFKGEGHLVAVNNPEQRVIVFVPGLPEVLKNGFGKMVFYMFLIVNTILFFGALILFSFAINSWNELRLVICMLFVATISISTLFFLATLRDELFGVLRTKKIMKLLGLSDFYRGMRGDSDGVRSHGFHY